MLSQQEATRVSKKKVWSENKRASGQKLDLSLKITEKERKKGFVPVSCPYLTDMPKTFKSPE